MILKALLIAIALVAASTGANAFSSSSSRGRWSNLTTEHMRQLPPGVRAAILNAQKICGEETASVRNGFLRYLKETNGDEFIALHFDQFHCQNRSALCTATGCLHQIFVARRGVAHHEVWRDHVQEIDMTNETGRMSANVECSGEGRRCATVLRWNGRQLVR